MNGKYDHLIKEIADRKGRQLSEDNFLDLDPETRFKALGRFTSETYEHDLLNFPEFFDYQGWPLFGFYDPYDIYHPIDDDGQKAPWYWHPREPNVAIVETDPDYETWYKIACEFSTKGSSYTHEDIKKISPVQALNLEGGASINSLAYIIKELQEDILPKIEPLILHRRHTIEFTDLWGRLQRRSMQLGHLMSKEKLYSIQREAGKQEENKDPQLKWYLYFRRENKDTLGTINKVNREFVRIVLGIMEDRIATPTSFSKDWFSEILSYNKKQRTYFEQLSDVFRRQTRTDRARVLMASLPSEEPAIPSFSAEDFVELSSVA